MTKELTTTGTKAVTDRQAVRRLQDTVDRFYGEIERGRIGKPEEDMLPVLPDADLRAQMDARQVVLRGALRPISTASADQNRASDAIKALLGGYLNIRSDNFKAVAAGYTAHLAEQPLFAILLACDDFKHHRVVDHVRDDGTTIYFTMDHAPSAYRLLDQVKKRAADAQTESYKIDRVLAITKLTPRSMMTEDEVAYVGEGLRLLAAGMAKRVTKDAEAERRKISEQADAARDRMRRILHDAAAGRATAAAPEKVSGEATQ